MKNIVTESLISSLEKTLSPGQSASEVEFLRAYYHRLSRQDFAAHRALDFRDLALRHRQIGTRRPPGETIIEIENRSSTGTSDLEPYESTIIHIVTEDRPFLIQSLQIALNGLRKTPFRSIYPLFVVTRDRHHTATTYERFTSPEQTEPDRCFAELYIQFEIDFTPVDEHEAILGALRVVNLTINDVVGDWGAMRSRMGECSTTVESMKKGPVFEEYGALLNWLTEDHFAFLGYCELNVPSSSGKTSSRMIESTALGSLKTIAKEGSQSVLEVLPPIVATADDPIILTMSRKRAAIHRPEHMDCILFNHGCDTTGKNSRVSCFLGFYAGSTAAMPTSDIPHLRKKTAYILETSRLRRGGYAYKELKAILETLPREKLFQMESSSLYTLSMTLLNQERRKTRVHLHKNVCGHYYSCLVYVPKDLFNSQLRQKIQQYLSDQLHAIDVGFNVYFSPSILTRIHYTIQADPDRVIDVDPDELERTIQNIARDWYDQLFEVIKKQSGRDRATTVLQQFRGGFSKTYEEIYAVENAATDIDIFLSLQRRDIHAVLSPSKRPDSDRASFKIYGRKNSIPLSDVLPVLENMGVRIMGGRPQKIQTTGGDVYRILEFEIARVDGLPFDYDRHGREFETTFIRCWHGDIENDGFNQLTLFSGLDWHRVSLFRAYFKYLKQIRLRYSRTYIIDALLSNPGLVTAISDLFTEQFDPEKDREGVEKIHAEVKSQLDTVGTLDEERILRALLDVMDATLRTNYFQPGENHSQKPYISLKLKSATIPRIPQPAPEFEIFVYSPRVEGVHLRGGPIARGGLRWSERPEDFRTEVLGLVKAQRVKNAVIVPVGSKGGFVARQLPDHGREEIQKEVIACYQIFISGLLDVTDNLAGTRIIPPDHVVRLDGDDPYLVVAADKGTATFSDIANSISEQRGFWLGDAFASGGSAGYDHKKMGITARGAWESVKRHFRERGKDIQSEPFTVVGIGDMGGDVFGNGMLLSKQIKLIAAFNHLHVFIDPNPDPLVSHAERQRLFDLPRSSWTDYDPKLISPGGGIFSRDAKSIALSPQAKKALGAKNDAYAPDDLINVILKSEVELLWNGGIGTYVKASSESHADAQDRNNDSLRVNGNELRCKVIGEGGNLGMTQLGRIEFSQHGGLCYTDAIDNSAGVDTSDHEVNIKILLNAEMQAGRLSLEDRNETLSNMEDDIARLVLQNNYLQTQVLSLDTENSVHAMPQQSRAIRILQKKGLLNRKLEFLPDNFTLRERFDEGRYLTRPELAVLLSYSKMDLYQNLLDSDLPDDPYLKSELEQYFPDLIRSKYLDQIHAHRLGREIIATQITNNLVGTMGSTFHLRIGGLTGNTAAEITGAYITARDILNSDSLMHQIQALDNQIDSAVQMQCLLQLSNCLESSILWLLRNLRQPMAIQPAIERFSSGYDRLINGVIEKRFHLPDRTGFEQDQAELARKGIPESLSQSLAARLILVNALDILEIAGDRQEPEQAAEIYFGIEKILGLDWLQNQITALPVENDWHERSKFSLSSDLRGHQDGIALKIVSTPSKQTSQQCLDQWTKDNQSTIRKYSAMIDSLKEEPHADFVMLSVAVSELNRFK